MVCRSINRHKIIKNTDHFKMEPGLRTDPEAEETLALCLL